MMVKDSTAVRCTPPAPDPARLFLRRYIPQNEPSLQAVKYNAPAWPPTAFTYRQIPGTTHTQASAQEHPSRQASLCLIQSIVTFEVHASEAAAVKPDPSLTDATCDASV